MTGPGCQWGQSGCRSLEHRVESGSELRAMVADEELEPPGVLVQVH
jgi:hypothetical protein